LLREPASPVTLLFRARTLRRRSGEVLERAAALRERCGQLLEVAGSLPRAHVAGPPGSHSGADGDAREEAEALQWYRVQIREMLAAGWTSAELADVGITDGLLRELGLHAAE
jgi:hypothetical protein